MRRPATADVRLGRNFSMDPSLRWDDGNSSFSRTFKQAIACAAVAAGLCGPFSAHAGNQKEEALADSVRVALSQAIHDARPPRPAFRDAQARARYGQWLGQMSERLKRKIPDAQARLEFLEAAWYESTRAGLDPGLVLGLIQVESAYRKYAVSIVGARGYMQVMPFWTKVIGDSNRRALFDMHTNLRYGCSILRMYIDIERGDLYLALGRYNGSRGKPKYPNAVLAAWKRWEFNSGYQLTSTKAPNANQATAAGTVPAGLSPALRGSAPSP